MFTTTIAAPTGVEVSKDAIIPVKEEAIEMTAEETTTFLKLPNSLIAETAGKTINADVRREPTRFIAKTITIAQITAINKLYSFTLIPVAVANASSNVTEKILLYNNTKATITIIEVIAHIQTSTYESVRIDVEPNKVLHTSVPMLEEEENALRSRYPIARAPTEIIASEASPFNFAEAPVHNRITAHKTVIGITIIILLSTFIIVAMVRAPNAT